MRVIKDDNISFLVAEFGLKQRILLNIGSAWSSCVTI